MPEELLRAFLLGILQGATEFLPVSSSGHLVILPELLHWQPPGLAFDAVVHAGTAVAVLWYFRHDWLELAASAWRALRGGERNDDCLRLLAMIGLGTVPAAVAGLAFRQTFEQLFATPRAAAAMLFVTGVLLVAAEQLGRQAPPVARLGPWGALFVGLAQAGAIAPGISRSGATIAAGQVAGLSRLEATRFSFLLAGPITAGAGLLEVAALLRHGTPTGNPLTVTVGFAAALISGYAAVGWLLGYVRRAPLYVFAAYVWLLGLAAWWMLG